MKILLHLICFTPMLLFGQQQALDSLIQSKINRTGAAPVYNFYFQKSQLNTTVAVAAGTISKTNQQKATTEDQFRIASTTKMMVATIILQLQEEDKLILKDKAQQYLQQVTFLDFSTLHYVAGKPKGKSITIQQLLQHQSGLADLFSDRSDQVFSSLFENPTLQYTPEKIVQLFYNLKLPEAGHFPAGKGWKYFDMNYVILGLIIEQLEGKPLAQVIRERILTPLSMDHTYLEFYEPKKGTQTETGQYFGTRNMREINTSIDWAGGGLVSNNADLIVFVTALFEGSLLKKESLALLLSLVDTGGKADPYGLGIFRTKFNTDIYYGHHGFYGTYVGYCPDKKIAISYSVGQVTPPFNLHTFIETVLSLL